jgi:uncharacterized protein YecE (DUF72 family)
MIAPEKLADELGCVARISRSRSPMAIRSGLGVGVIAVMPNDYVRYLYSEDELCGWVGPVRALAEQAERVHVLMNNCYRDYAVRNARQLAATRCRPQFDFSLSDARHNFHVGLAHMNKR